MAKFYDNTLEHVMIQQENTDEEKYKDVEVPPMLKT